MFGQLQTGRRAVTRHAVAASRAGFDAHEQALTEILLTRVAPPARVWTFSQRAEGTSGADWLWWWHSPGEWFGALVQAKRNKPRRGLPWYDFKYQTPGGKRQVDLLLATARLLNLPAVYVLYNHPGIPSSVRIGRQCCSARETWRTRLRVAVLPGLVAASLAETADAPQYSLPIECLCCRDGRPRLLPLVRRAMTDERLVAFLDNRPSTLARTVPRVLIQELTRARLEHFRAGSMGTPPVPGADEDTVFAGLSDDQGHFAEPYLPHVLRGLRTRPPWYIEALLNGTPPDTVAQDLPDIAGVVLTSDL